MRLSWRHGAVVVLLLCNISHRPAYAAFVIAREGYTLLALVHHTQRPITLQVGHRSAVFTTIHGVLGKARMLVCFVPVASCASPVDIITSSESWRICLTSLGSDGQYGCCQYVLLELVTDAT